jgi:polar amino acid transport system substrate-binding protein/glutamate/aspartate transport system substrate-binding protein
MKRFGWAAALAVAVIAAPAAAQQPTGTLKKIADGRSISLGYRVEAVPFSYRGADGLPAGYSVDICRRVVTAVERALNVSNLEVKWVPVTAESRIAQVTSGAVDLECGVTTVTLGRQEQVDFSNLIFAEGGSLLVRANGGPLRLADLAGKTVGVIPGTTTETRLRAILKERLIDARIVGMKDERDGAGAVMEQRIDAFAGDRLVLLGAGLRTGGGDVLSLALEDFSFEPYGLMMRRGDPAFRLVVNRALAQLYSGPGIGEIYERWFGKLGRPGPLLVAMYHLNAFAE